MRKTISLRELKWNLLHLQVNWFPYLELIMLPVLLINLWLFVVVRQQF